MVLRLHLGLNGRRGFVDRASLAFELAHTRGDTGVFVEGDGVLFSGDVVMNNSFLSAMPVSSMKAWLAAFNTFEAFKPTIIVPFFGDQLFWAPQVEMLGAGPRSIARKDLSGERLADAIRAAIGNPSIADKAAALGAGIRAEDGLKAAGEVVSEYLNHT